MKQILPFMVAAALAVASPTMLNGSPLTFTHTRDNNCLVRVDDANQRYILLPVQESLPDSEVRIMVDGKLEKTVKVRLAADKVDYYVPLDIARWQGKHLQLDIRGPQCRDLDTKAFRLSDEFDTTNREKFRPAYHHTPVWGWMNDPNGMFYKDGKWHLYYQWNPYGSKWENLSWGHSVSDNLVDWQDMGAAVEPDDLGYIFSGSSVVDHANTTGFGKDAIVGLWTSCDVDQVQSLGHSEDGGNTFIAYEGNPVIAYERETRDPNMFWDAKNNRWVLLLASALDHEMVIFTSPDMKEWTEQSKFGKGYGAQDGVWECPDLMELPIRGEKGTKWVLLCNINPGAPFGGSGTQYFVGDFDGVTFTPDTKPSVSKWLDYGKDNYANVSWSNQPKGRHAIIGWMSNWQYAADVPTQQFRSANTLPRELELFRAPDGDLYLASTPAPEVQKLRKSEKSYHAQTIDTKGFTIPVPALAEIVLDVEAGTANRIHIVLENQSGQSVEMAYDMASQTFTMDRYSSGITDFSPAFPAVTAAPLRSDARSQQLKLFIDRSSLEAFAGDGRWAMTNLVFPDTPYDHLTVSTPDGTARINSLTVYQLR